MTRPTKLRDASRQRDDLFEEATSQGLALADELRLWWSRNYPKVFSVLIAGIVAGFVVSRARFERSQE